MKEGPGHRGLTQLLKGLVFALILVGGDALHAQQVTKRHAKSGQDSSYAHQRGADTLPVYVKLMNTGRGVADSINDAAEIAEQRHLNNWTIGGTVALVIVTVRLVVVAGVQACFLYVQAGRLKDTVVVTQRMAQEQATAMQKSIAAAESSAVFTGQTVAVVRDTAERQLRAYISVLGGLILQTPERGGVRYVAKPVIVNLGVTPAHDVQFSITMEVLPFPIPVGHVFELGAERISQWSDFTPEAC